MAQPHVRTACSLLDRCIVILDPSILRSPRAVRYDYSSFETIIVILILVQIKRIDVAEMPRILLLNRVPSRWKSLMSALRLRTLRTRAILGRCIFALLVLRHVWLESWAKTLYSGWDPLTAL